MTAHTYRVTEIVGTSSKSVDDAIANGVARVAQTIRGVDWFEVTEIRGHVQDGAIGHYQVGLKVGFCIESAED